MRVTFKTLFETPPGMNPRHPYLNDPAVWIDTLLTDSRNLSKPASTLFFAISTPGGNDGHNYIEDLYRKGVRNFVVEYVPEFLKEKDDVNVAVVENTVATLQNIGWCFGSHPSVETVAITGSRGKTTLKEILFQLLEPLKKVSRSPRSYNSQIGVPISLWQVDPEADISLIEAGISTTGEMERLAGIIMPDTVIITNILSDHDEGFNDLSEKIDEKLLLAQVPSVKMIIYNHDDNLIREKVKKIVNKVDYLDSSGWSFKDEMADVFLNVVEKKEEKIRIKVKAGGKDFEVETICSNDYDLENIAISIAFMLYENIDVKTIQQRFHSLKTTGTRLDVSEGVNNSIVIRDSYLSDLNSLEPAINFMLRRQTPGQVSMIIMEAPVHELSGNNKAFERIAALLKERKIDKFIGIGKGFEDHSQYFPASAEFYATASDFLLSKNRKAFSRSIILIKGNAEGFDRIAEMLEARSHETVLEVNLDAIVENYNYFRSYLPHGVGIIAMVKASGYGAGSFEIAKTLQDAGAAYLAVAVTDEGVDLRKNGITMPIMVMNPKASNYDALFADHIEPEIYSFDLLREFIDEALKRGIKDYPIHLKLDTGMHRLGFRESEIDQLISYLQVWQQVRVSSIFSHLATADCPDMDDYTLMQLHLFEKMSEQIIRGLGYPVKRHILNSAGILRFPEYHYDFVRLGIGLYGANTLPPDMEKPLAVVSSLKSVIIAIRDYKAGDTIGYGRRGVLKRDSRIATVPVGYADGLNRKFGNGNISMKVNGHDAPTVGNICMDACMIDVTGIECKVGTSVEIFGTQAPLSRLADLLDTIPYEILTSVSPRVKRIYFRE